MKICTLASSSSGNCTLISHEDTHLLIDAGISLRRITACLKALGLTPGDLTGVLVTHEHSDHIGGLRMLVKYHRTQIFAPPGVTDGICRAMPELRCGISALKAGMEFVLGEIAVRSFPTPHDTPESVGYRLDDGRKTLVFVTDIGCVTKTIFDAAAGADMAIIEANHDVVMLRNGPYPSYLKRRILSARGHLSNDDSGIFAAKLLETGTRRIILAHLSKENNTPRLAYDTVGGALRKRGAVVGGDVMLETAPADTMGPVYIL